MLRERRDICRYVRKLAVRPNYYLAWPKPDEELSEVWVVDTIEDISKDLVMMHTFDWDGLEQPKDSLWTTLRLKCALNFPSLHRIKLTSLQLPSTQKRVFKRRNATP